MISFYNLEEVDWKRVKHYYKEEGFYLFGGFLQSGEATNELWILKSETEHLKWIKGETQGLAPEPRYQHAITKFEKENALIISGGRNDKIN